ncbi:hypothetical protein NAEGRDRAFT_81948 [Naegleria gruberi]|uniref:Uncharacterized protein n=1 Tax=Naegleria gruberi TaxID=5762 RepID=D2W0P6_NAEGR|nr:uncharacterized protein NAEGRDRAFT_81948 [Naegleria gruberi]EFC37328.1 hypothetical protein NAEGRDRAFT_81948 [Naegleria gruberi]|eukprot:XP_002670072.1 hypothetical protein NAEGRDRAFT_81948 [Naegleria gruberi strain NEG-M]
MIVVSKYTEDVSWLDTYLPHIPHAVYDRLNPQAPYIVHSNRGHEGSTYLKYIIDHYETLPENIVFVHGHRIAWHCRDMVTILENLHWGKFDYVSLNPAYFQVLNSTSSDYLAVSKYWPRLFEDTLGQMPPLIKDWCCASFHVKGKRIRRHPKSFYLRLYEWLQSGEEENYWSSRIMEHVWVLMFASKTPEPDVNLCDIANCRNIVGHRAFSFKTVNGELRELNQLEQKLLYLQRNPHIKDI